VAYALNLAKPSYEACVATAEGSPTPILTAVQGNWKPWGVLIAQDFSASVATARFDRVSEKFAPLLGGEQILMLTVQNPNFGRKPRHSAMVGRDGREQAEALCEALRGQAAAALWSRTRVPSGLKPGLSTLPRKLEFPPNRTAQNAGSDSRHGDAPTIAL
jgi:hypothetical protein